ncbi:antitoxin Xre/MbcA/ParS toxin-binding domain-containing protein [Spirosoma aerolatum]|uniref:antitoxin Xre/MbcA/ParS toxin-binding domain-containing protein n=1 Tax=Spirosoma aerolatum TaxID=1211326 RepID=UPI0009AF1CA5|nr:antitoxin Xre/MbcA/ParS toxin-binding domain-containing protein [Spirosoma aerolatum]
MATSTYQAASLTRSSPFGVIDSSRQGMLRAQVDEVAALVGLTDREMAYALNMTPRNLHRLKAEQRVRVDASERLLLLKNLLVHALDTFEGRKTTVLHWLRTPIRELANQSPLQLLDTVTGFGLADDVLGRLDYGLPA